MESRLTNSRGKRYTAAEKDEILAFVRQVNEKLGRGGAARAARRFGVTPLTIHNWLRAAEDPISRGRQSGRNPELLKSLQRMAELHERIAKLEQDLVDLHKEYRNVKVSL